MSNDDHDHAMRPAAHDNQHQAARIQMEITNGLPRDVPPALPLSNDHIRGSGWPTSVAWLTPDERVAYEYPDGRRVNVPEAPLLEPNMVHPRTLEHAAHLLLVRMRDDPRKLRRNNHEDDLVCYVTVRSPVRTGSSTPLWHVMASVFIEERGLTLVDVSGAIAGNETDGDVGDPVA